MGWICRQGPGLEEAEGGVRAEPLVAGEADSFKKSMPLWQPSLLTSWTLHHTASPTSFLSQSQYITFKCHGIYTLNEWTLWYVNYISIRLFKNVMRTGPLLNNVLQEAQFPLLSTFSKSFRRASRLLPSFHSNSRPPLLSPSLQFPTVHPWSCL